MAELPIREEQNSLRTQFATSKTGRGGRRYAAFVFTDHGAILAATILNFPRANAGVIDTIRQMMRSAEHTKRGIGFLADLD